MDHHHFRIYERLTKDIFDNRGKNFFLSNDNYQVTMMFDDLFNKNLQFFFFFG